MNAEGSREYQGGLADFFRALIPEISAALVSSFPFDIRDFHLGLAVGNLKSRIKKKETIIEAPPKRNARK